MEKIPILLVEDEPKVASSIQQWLLEHDFLVDVAPDGAVGRHLALTNDYALILLDLNLPFIDGFEVCKAIRSTKPDVPIIMVTALGSMDEKLNGFAVGANDYLVKPFDFRELLARMRVLLKNAVSFNTDNPSLLKVADLEMNLDTKNVYRAGHLIPLTPKEFGLLVFLIKNEGRVVSKYDIMEQVWDLNFDSGTNVVEVYINFLRKKIDRNYEPKLIHTKPGMGYYLAAN
ncbi:response regulator [Haliscomenobacter hydrossis]|uniref:Two component transcriptional regulator, winged helix family n=1 Tax=Haliscomenobacter hydrossis (strain ATCC 27775 / DSM 1100 / LMG 10767 / O) TaxID=760192 RepID=F4L4X3_HALH1|nr:response regulator [Haliscomenobacter hydrossis]AEE54035.1 two component transcriptional regulator, winged helix family [Haliscomenobacter hydrossis DSM 1100]